MGFLYCYNNIYLLKSKYLDIRLDNIDTYTW